MGTPCHLPRNPEFHSRLMNQRETKDSRTPIGQSSAGVALALNSSSLVVRERQPLRLPVSNASPCARKLLCISSYGDDIPWLRTIHPHQVAWAERNQVELKIVKSPPATSFSRSAIHTGLEFFLKSDADWLLFLDPRVMIHPLAPNPLSAGLAPGIWVLPLPEQEPVRRNWAKWVGQSFQRVPSRSHRYRDGAVVLLDRATANEWLSYTEEMTLSDVPEGYYLNLWLHRADSDEKIMIHDLPPEWNRLSHGISAPGWFYQCEGPEPSKALESLQMKGYLPLPRPAVEIKPWPEEADQEHLVAVPYLLETDIWKSEALRYSLRSLEMYFEPDWPLVVYGTKRPDWLREDVFEHEPTYPQAILRAHCKSRKVLIMSDDILFLKPTSEEDLKIPGYLPDLVPMLPAMLQNENRWQRSRAYITGRLYHENGVDRVLDFSTHTPGLYHRDHARKTFDHFGVWYKFPFELAYHGLLGSQGRPCDDKANLESRDNPAMRWINLDDKWAGNEEFVGWMAARFPKPSKWEKP